MISKERTSGILLHPTSLPGPYGIGDLGKEAYKFVDFLEASGQHIWQVLPLTHTGYGDSPYQSFSAFAGQPLLISPTHLLNLGLLTKEDLDDCPVTDPHHIDYGTIIPWKTAVLKKAFKTITSHPNKYVALYNEFNIFNQKEAFWLEDYSLFMACKDANKGVSWLEWPEEYRIPTPEFKRELKETLSESMYYYKFLQFFFFKEWNALKEYANAHGVKIVGDIPIFVSMDSADVWANPALFQLDSKGFPLAVAGVPPDYFSATGQLWGNPLYKWDVHIYTDFQWWISRVEHQLKTVDILRIDHFRGFEAYWSIPYGEKTAINGQWIKAPGRELFTKVQEALGDDLPIIAEDLGIITAEVDALRTHFKFPGMKVLQFAFESLDESSYLPHNYPDPNCVCYTGTHDNDTTMGWFKTLKPECQKKVRAYTSNTLTRPLSHSLIKTALASIANTVVFPLQDVLALGTEGRMNTPGVAAGNWNWRFVDGDLSAKAAEVLKETSRLYGRY
ncbi:MAG: 4-alpha-glucanotransferase [Dorea sp.]|nr:4-alpha-glucanotransferase [Dorea sp.]